MGKIQLVCDLSPNWPANFSALRKLRDSALKPADNEAEKIVSRTIPWKRINRHRDAILENQFASLLPKWRSELAQVLDNGQSLALYGQNYSFRNYAALIHLLRNSPETRRSDIKAIVLLGLPDIVLEQYARNRPISHFDRINFSEIDALSSPDRLVLDLRDKLGDANVQLVINQRESQFAADATDSVLQEMFNIPAKVEIGNNNPLAYKSVEARELFFVISRLKNAWPSLDKDRLGAALRQIDEEFPPQFITEAAERQKIYSLWQASIARIDKKFFIRAEFSQDNCRDFAPRGSGGDFASAFKKFMNLLPASELALLRGRLESVRPLLEPRQKELLENLEQNDFKEISVMESGKEKPLLTVLTLAFNHEKYIAECIKRVAAQKTDFRIRHIIVDDCSTDGTVGIIGKYAEKYDFLQPVALPTHSMRGSNVHTLFSLADTEYVALCDGDDYFTDPFKLQKQVDFLRNNPQCSLCFHPVSVVYEDGSPAQQYPTEEMAPRSRTFYSINDLVQGNIIQTNSVVYRWRFRDGLPKWFRPDLSPGDWYWHLLHAEKGLLGFLPEVMSVYRRHKGAVYASAEKGHTFHRSRHGMRELEFYDVCNAHFKRRYEGDFMRLATGVFADFVRVYMDSGDDALLNEACSRFPSFGKIFFSQLSLEKDEAEK